MRDQLIISPVILITTKPQVMRMPEAELFLMVEASTILKATLKTIT